MFKSNDKDKLSDRLLADLPLFEELSDTQSEKVKGGRTIPIGPHWRIIDSGYLMVQLRK